jgi:hypothetical protein
MPLLNDVIHCVAVRVRAYFYVGMVLLFLCGCMKIEDTQYCVYQNNSGLTTSPVKQGGENAHEYAYINGHLVRPSDSSHVLYIEKIRYIKNWGVDRFPHHPLGKSVQASIEIKNKKFLALKNEPFPKIDLQKAAFFVSDSSTGFARRTTPIPGRMVVASSAKNATVQGAVSTTSEKLTGKIEFLGLKTEGEGTQNKLLIVNCRPQIVPPKSFEPCAGQAWWKCGESDERRANIKLEPTTESRYVFCPFGFEDCEQKHYHPLEPITTSKR